VPARLPRALLLLAWAAAVAAPASAAGLQPADLHRLQTVVDARISPDATRVAYTVRDPSGPGGAAVETRVLELAGSRTAVLGPGAAWSPRWSPDGRRLAYRAAGAAGVSLMVCDADGSRARALAPLASTNESLPSTGEALAWSPDGKRIAFVSAEAPAARPSEDPVVITRYLYKPTASEGETRASDGRRLHVYVVDAAGGAPRPLTKGDSHEHSIAWSPSGDEIAFVSDRDGDERVFNYDLWAVRVADASLRRLSASATAEYSPAWSPDGRRIAFLATKRPLTSSETTMEDEHAYWMDAAGGPRTEAGAAIDNRQGDPVWSAGGDALLLTVQERGDVALYRVPLAGAPSRVAPAAGSSGVVSAWSVARDGTLAYALATREGPAELYVSGPSGARRITSLNEPLLRERGLAPVESLRFASFDGLEIEAFLTQPLGGPPAGGGSPLIVILHGGPHGQQGAAFNARAQVYAARGWASLQVNYRGSTGYGQKLADAIFGDQNGGEARDVLAAVDAALARHSWLDADRIGVEGGSYGGQLVNWLVTQTGRFRAGVSLAGISNLVSFHYMAYYHDYLPVEFGAWPHEGALLDRLWERSPIRYVARVRTPVLLLHGENDNDVPVAEAEQFYIALHEVGVPTEMVRYPREGHGVRETGHQVDALQRSIDWYQKWFTSPRPEPRPLSAK
jgi:dipeptidyl aminopeptidase/acylaminoacyl peptidase